MNGRLRRLNSSSSGIHDAARCHSCNHPARIHNGAGCVFGPCECVVPLAELMPGAPRLEVPDGIEPTPATAPAKPAPPAVVASAPAVAAAAPAGPGGVEAAPQPVTVLPPWLPGTGIAKVKPPTPVAPVATPDEDVVRRVDDIIAAGKVAAKRPPRLRTPRTAGRALGGPAVDCEDDAEEVAAVASTAVVATPADVRWGPLPDGVHATPEPLDISPFLGASLHAYHAWYCAPCFQRRHDPGACPDCSGPLVPVHVIVYPRETS